MTNFNFVQVIGKLPSDAKIAYYLNFAHSLTIAVRGIWSDEALDVADQLERLKWMNELMHRVINRVIDLRAESHTWNEADIWQMLLTTVAQCPAINGDAGGAMLSAYERTLQQFGDRINPTP
jgi:hypothetical protein